MFSSRLGISLVLGASLALGACKGGGAPKEDLALVPQDAEIVVGINLARMRGTAMWKKFMDLAMSQEQSKKSYEDFNKACVDFGAADGPQSVFVALPQMTNTTKDGAVIIRLKSAIDDARLQKCGEFIASKNGDKMVSTDYHGKKIYNGGSGDADKGGVTLLDGKTVAFGSGAWIKKVIDIAGGKEQATAKKNEALMALVKRAKTSDAMWGAGLVSQATRDQLKNDPHLSAAGSMKDVFGSIDFANGFAADINVDVGSDADAKDLTVKIQSQLNDTKKNPQVMMMGVASLLDQVKIDAKQATFHVAINYNQQQVDDIINRVKGFLKSLGGAMQGGGFGGNLGQPPMQMPPQ